MQDNKKITGQMLKAK